MQIQVNTDDNVKGSEALTRHIKAEVGATLSRFGDHITRLEIHLSDENAGKSGSSDKRCLIEARPAGRHPVSVSNEGATLEEAVSGASKKLKRLLESELGRLAERKGAATVRGHDGL